MDGFYSSLIIISLAILFITGWFTSKPLNIGTNQRIGSFLLFMFLLNLFDIPLSNGVEMNIGGFLLPIIVYFSFWFYTDAKSRINLFATTILLGTSYFLMRKLFYIDPILLFVEERFQIPIFITLLSLIVENDLVKRILLIFGGNLLGELIFSFYSKELMGQTLLGDGYFRDILWISIIMVSITHYVIKLIMGFVKQKIIWKQSIR